jgi:hypothetical protein
MPTPSMFHVEAVFTALLVTVFTMEHQHSHVENYSGVTGFSLSEIGDQHLLTLPSNGYTSHYITAFNVLYIAELCETHEV